MELPLVNTPVPQVALTHLDQLWFQVGGTVCNLQCRHCFISCSPHNHSFGYLDLETVGRWLEDSKTLRVKEYYFTGGEPFLNRDMTAILERTLQYGPATILTNGTVFRDDWLRRLQDAERASIYSLEFRVSLDGFTAEQNDPVRGEGTFERILRGVEQLTRFEFLPILTVTQTRDDQDEVELFEGFARLLRERGISRPRIKILPTLRIGAESQRWRGYAGHERVTIEMMADYDTDLLLCSHARMVTDRGVFACPILIESRSAYMGPDLEAGLAPVDLREQACHTCYLHGALCSNPASVERNA